MNLSFILFFISLAGIIIMIWRKMALQRNGEIVEIQHLHPITLDSQKIKQLTYKIIRKSGYMIIFVSIRSYLLSSKFMKEKSKILIQKTKDRFKKNKDNPLGEIKEKKEVSKYLRVISDYKQKIKKIKHKIKEEEGIK